MTPTVINARIRDLHVHTTDVQELKEIRDDIERLSSNLDKLDCYRFLCWTLINVE